MSTTPQTTLAWYDTEDGYVIIGTTDRSQAAHLHDQLVDDHLAGMEDIDDHKAAALNPPALLYVRPDHAHVEDEDVSLTFDPVTGKPHTADTGVPALFFNVN